MHRSDLSPGALDRLSPSAARRRAGAEAGGPPPGDRARVGHDCAGHHASQTAAHRGGRNCLAGREGAESLQMGQHFEIAITDTQLRYTGERRVSHGSGPRWGLCAPDQCGQRHPLPHEYRQRVQSLAGVERAFRSLKTVDLSVRPIGHRLAERVRAHVFLCMLAYYVEWHMRQALAPLLFDDDDKAAGRPAGPPSSRRHNAPRKPGGKPTPTGPTMACRCIVSRRCSKIWPPWQRTGSVSARAPWRRRCSRHLRRCSSGPWTCAALPQRVGSNGLINFFVLFQNRYCGQF